MTRGEAKERELRDISALIQGWPEWRDSPPSIISSERPDAILVFQDRTVGLEHTVLVPSEYAVGDAAVKRQMAPSQDRPWGIPTKESVITED